MKRWAWIVVLLYGLAIVVLTLPVIIGAFWDFQKAENNSGLSIERLKAVYLSWPYWSGLAVFMLSQAALLLIPVRVSETRPIAKRTLLLPVITSAFLTGLLGSGLVLAIFETIRGEYLLEEQIWWWIALSVLLVTWFIWGIVFFGWSKKYEPKSFVDKVCRYLFKGSILELLIAVPTHIAARYKNYCCAGFGTFFGITFGLAIMLFSFGPGVFFLFVERWKRLHPEHVSTRKEVKD